MEKNILIEEKIKKFDDVHIKSMNLSGVVYAIKGNDVVVNTVRKGLVKAKLDDLKKIYTDSVNEADVVGKTIFSNGKGKLFFGYYKTDDAVEFVDYKTWKKLNFKDVSKGDFNKNRVIDSILRSQKQFNKKVDYNMWAKKTNPSFEEKMDWFIKNGWITNITKTGIKEGIESVNEGAMSDIDIIANEAKDFKDFVKQFYAEYTNFPKNKESLKWLEDIYKGRTKMEGLERVASALPQTKEEPVTEGDEKSPEEILKGLREMAMGDLERIEDYAEMISDRMKEGQELSSWMYSQITLAVDQLNSVHDAMDGNDGVKESVNEAKEFPTKEQLVTYMVKRGHNKKDSEKVVDANYDYVKKHYQNAGLPKISDILWTVESVNEAKSLDDMMKDANRIKKELADAQKEYSKSKTETNKAKVEAKKGQLERIANAIRNERANQRESVNEGSLYSSQQLIKKLTPKIEKDVEVLKKQFPKYDITLVRNRYESDGSYTLSISGKNTSDTDNKNIEKVVSSKIKESVNEHKDCGCGCGGVTEGGCGTSIKEEKLNEWRAEEVLQQLGGRKFIAMTGAKNFVKNDKDKSITFKIPRAKDGITHVMITLNASDTYTINFLSIRGNNIKQKPVKGVYNDQLQSVFTQYTGLNTSL